MSEEPVYTCAVWYVSEYGRTEYELCESDEEATRNAAALEVYTDASVLGLQRADGSLVPYRRWAAMHEQMRLVAERREQAWSKRVPPVTRRSADPFWGHALAIEVTEPDWLGVPSRDTTEKESGDV